MSRPIRRHKKIFASTVLLLLTSAGAARAEGMPQPMLGTDAPGFELATVAGDTLALGDLKGRYVVMHFGASW